MKSRSALVVALAAISLLIIAAIVVVTVIRTRHPSPQMQSASFAPTIGTAQIGSAAPEFSLPTTNGPFDLDKQTRPVLLEVFASWCPHCQRETAVMNRLYRSFKSRVAFIAVPGSTTAMDGASPESQFDIINFQIRFNVKYPIAAYDPNLTVARQYLKGGYPTIVIVGLDKKIVYANSGEVPYAELAAALDQSLGGKR